DFGLSGFDRARWLVLNRLNNSCPRCDLDPALELRRFDTRHCGHQWWQIERCVSPARRLCDLFWLSLPWDRITQEFGHHIRVLEIGCGTGRYALLLKEC